MNADLQAKLAGLSEEQQATILEAINAAAPAEQQEVTAPPTLTINTPQGRAKFERESQAYVNHLLSKRELTKDEQVYIARELAVWRRESGIR